jgi:Tubulin-tyrosine ligase family
MISSKGIVEKKKPSSKDRPRRSTHSICILANYTIVKTAADRLGLLEVGERSAWNVLWTDAALTVQQCLAVERFQMVNFFPGIQEITRKDLLARNLGRMQKAFPEDYDFFPKTWWLPADFKVRIKFDIICKKNLVPNCFNFRSCSSTQNCKRAAITL